jgi:hypothetical protein
MSLQLVANSGAMKRPVHAGHVLYLLNDTQGIFFKDVPRMLGFSYADTQPKASSYLESKFRVLQNRAFDIGFQYKTGYRSLTTISKHPGLYSDCCHSNGHAVCCWGAEVLAQIHEQHSSFRIESIR